MLDEPRQEPSAGEREGVPLRKKTALQPGSARGHLSQANSPQPSATGYLSQEPTGAEGAACWARKTRTRLPGYLRGWRQAITKCGYASATTTVALAVAVFCPRPSPTVSSHPRARHPVDLAARAASPTGCSPGYFTKGRDDRADQRGRASAVCIRLCLRERTGPLNKVIGVRLTTGLVRYSGQGGQKYASSHLELFRTVQRRVDWGADLFRACGR